MASTYGTPLPEVMPALCDSRRAAELRTRNVVICLDGTGDQFDGDNSNVVKFFAALKKDDPTQLCYYQSGVGTYSRSSLKGGVSAALDMAVGSSLGLHVRQAYSFLMQNYREGDKVCIIGFSRGAYTARALAGMIHKVGLLPAHNQAQIQFAYKFYKDDTRLGWEMSVDFKRTFSIDIDIDFLGCWDTVASVGFIPRFLPFAKTSNSSVLSFRHALALDERRAKFKANHWLQREGRRGDSTALSSSQKKRAGGVDKEPYGVGDDVEASFHHALASHHRREHTSNARANDTKAPRGSRFEEMHRVAEEEEEKTSSKPAQQQISPAHMQEIEKKTAKLPPGDKKAKQLALMKEFEEKEKREFGALKRGTDALEVWFLGCHADCGGGAVPNETRHMVSRIPLRWMIRQAFACNTGLLFRTDVLAEHGLDVDSLWPCLLDRTQSSIAMEPAPSVLDRYAVSKVTSLAQRRDAVRRRILQEDSDEYQGQGGSEQEPDRRSEDSQSSTTLMGHADSSKEEGVNKDRNSLWPADYPPEYHEDYFDCLARINDQLVDAKGWWILEFWPIKYRICKGKDNWHKVRGPNLGRFRSVREHFPKAHWTVFERARHLDYKIRCHTEQDVDWRTTY